jgi:hypothetical protein
MTKLVIEERPALAVGHLKRAPERPEQQDDEVELRELTIEVAGLLTLVEDDATVDVGLSRGAPRQRDPGATQIVVMRIDEFTRTP